MKAKVLSPDWKEEWLALETLTHKEVFIGFLLSLSNLNPPWA